ncbi:MAG: hypothetical protein J1E01_11730 [Acetatifactor sp.]|nr:hypothetical protein [Acetatifactor sp.]
MKLKKNIDLNQFLEAARKCEGDTFLHTVEGDILNLKSLLSQYTVMSIMGHNHVLENAQVICVKEENYQKLADFLEETE